MNRQRKQKIRDIQSDDELSESGPEISDAEDYAEGMILFQQLSLTRGNTIYFNAKIFTFW